MVSVGAFFTSSKDFSRAVIKLLRLLSRKGVCVYEPAEGVDAAPGARDCEKGLDAGTVEPELGVFSEGNADLVGTVPREAFELAFSKGFLVKDGDEPCWRISAHGVTFLKRSMSRGAGELTGGSDCGASGGAPTSRSLSREGDEDSPLAWLRARKDRYGQALITQQQFDAGERLRGDFYAGHLNERVTMNWSGFHVRAGQGSGFRDRELSLGEAASAARERVRRAMRDVGPELSGVLVDVCCYGKKLTAFEREHAFPQRAGKVVLCLGLSALARHYGIGRAKCGRRQVL